MIKSVEAAKNAAFLRELTGNNDAAAASATISENSVMSS
jgi:hypothetical protein